MEPSLALQSAIRARIVAASSVTSLVPTSSILDVNKQPGTFPAIIIGEAQTLPDDGLARDRHEVSFDLHLWAQEPGTTFIKQVAGAVRGALSDTLWNVPGLQRR